MDKVVVSVAEGHLGELSVVLAELEKAGLVVDTVQEPLGTVTVSVRADAIGLLEQVPGVAVVERAHRYQLPHPDAGIQ